MWGPNHFLILQSIWYDNNLRRCSLGAPEVIIAYRVSQGGGRKRRVLTCGGAILRKELHEGTLNVVRTP